MYVPNVCMIEGKLEADWTVPMKNFDGDGRYKQIIQAHAAH